MHSKDAAHVTTHREQAIQEKTNPNDTERTKTQVRSLSPYDIASFITDNPQADLRQIWAQLGIKKPNFGDSSDKEEEQNQQTDRFLTKCNNCAVETFVYDLIGEPGREFLLRVSDRAAESCRYLVFNRLNDRSKADWRLLGYIDHGFGRYRMPEHFIVNSGGKNWLVVKVQQGSGSAFAVYWDRLFQVESDSIKEILRVPSEGHLSTSGSYPTNEFTTKIVDCAVNNSVTTVHLEFSVSYSAFTASGEEVLLWNKKQTAFYRRDSTTNQVALDRSNSDLPEEEIAAIYVRDWLSDDDFIKYNKEELTEIAQGPDNNRKKWLRLQEGQSKEKESLRQLIDK